MPLGYIRLTVEESPAARAPATNQPRTSSRVVLAGRGASLDTDDGTGAKDQDHRLEEIRASPRDIVDGLVRSAKHRWSLQTVGCK